MTNYTYAISGFLNQKVSIDKLEQQIKDSAIVTALDSTITTSTDCIITFKSSLSEGDKTILDGVVAAHDGNFLPENEPIQVINYDFPKDSNGVPKVSKYFPALGMIPCWKGYQFDTNIGQTTFFDIEVWDYIRISSGVGWVSGISENDWDDYIEFSVVDKNDVLGLFSTYGLTVGQDVLELKKFLRTEYVRKGTESNEFKLDMTLTDVLADPVIPGLFFRIAYVCDPDDHEGQTGEVAPHVVIRLHYYEA